MCASFEDVTFWHNRMSIVCFEAKLKVSAVIRGRCRSYVGHEMRGLSLFMFVLLVL